MTIRDIARAANVSPATVSMIINKKDSNISQETRDRVLQIIDECGYVPYASIRERIMPRSRTIGLVLPALDSGFEMRFVSVLQRIAREQDYSLVLALTGGSADTERSAFEDFVRNRAEGILCLFGSENCLSLLEETAAQGLYAVSLDHHLKTARFPLLYRDSARIVRECTDLLVEHNCRRIGLVLQPDCPDDLRQILLESYTSSLSDGGLPFQQNFVLTRDAHLLENFRSVVDGGLDAVVCQDVITAQTVYTLAAKDGLRIPEDISVISMEDSEDAAMLSLP